MAIGTECLAMGVTWSMKAQIGASPQGCCPAVFSKPLGLSVGRVTWILYTIFLLIQVWALGKEFSIWALLQLPFSFLYGYMLDGTLWLFRVFPEDGWFFHVLYCLLGIFFFSIGVKLVADATMVTIAVTGSLLFYHRLVQVGIGTVFAALTLGRTIGWMKNRKTFDQWLERLILA